MFVLYLGFIAHQHTYRREISIPASYPSKHTMRYHRREDASNRSYSTASGCILHLGAVSIWCRLV